VDTTRSCVAVARQAQQIFFCIKEEEEEEEEDRKKKHRQREKRTAQIGANCATMSRQHTLLTLHQDIKCGNRKQAPATQKEF
jgi:hypothetical protein